MSTSPRYVSLNKALRSRPTAPLKRKLQDEYRRKRPPITLAKLGDDERGEERRESAEAKR